MLRAIMPISRLKENLKILKEMLLLYTECNTLAKWHTMLIKRVDVVVFDHFASDVLNVVCL